MGAFWSRQEVMGQPGRRANDEISWGPDFFDDPMNNRKQMTEVPTKLTLRELLSEEPDNFEEGPAPDPVAPDSPAQEPDVIPTPPPEPESAKHWLEAAPSRSLFLYLTCCCDPMDEEMPDPYDDGKDLNLDFNKPHVDPVTGGRFIYCPQGGRAHCHATNCGAPILDPGERPAYVAAYRKRYRQAQALGKI